MSHPLKSVRVALPVHFVHSQTLVTQVNRSANRWRSFNCSFSQFDASRLSLWLSRPFLPFLLSLYTAAYSFFVLFLFLIIVLTFEKLLFGMYCMQHTFHTLAPISTKNGVAARNMISHTLLFCPNSIFTHFTNSQCNKKKRV